MSDWFGTKLEPGTRKSCPHKSFYNFQHAQKCFIYVRNWWEILPNHFRCKCCVHHSSEQRWSSFSFLDSNKKSPNRTSMTISSVLTAEHIVRLSFYFFIPLVYLKETDINFLQSRACYSLETAWSHSICRKRVWERECHNNMLTLTHHSDFWSRVLCLCCFCEILEPKLWLRGRQSL